MPSPGIAPLHPEKPPGTIILGQLPLGLYMGFLKSCISVPFSETPVHGHGPFCVMYTVITFRWLPVILTRATLTQSVLHACCWISANHFKVNHSNFLSSHACKSEVLLFRVKINHWNVSFSTFPTDTIGDRPNFFSLSFAGHSLILPVALTK